MCATQLLQIKNDFHWCLSNYWKEQINKKHAMKVESLICLA
jgi:hypothetical protein